MRLKLLFICSRNQWRSPTAEALLRGHIGYEARSAGTSEAARVRVNAGHIEWADRIFVMEKRHRQLLEQRFGHDVKGKSVTVLDIPDEYQANDPELVALLRDRLTSHLEGFD